MRHRFTGSTAIAALGLALLAGCGSSSSSSSPTTTSKAATSVATSQTAASAGQFKAALAPVLSQFKAASHNTGVELQNASSQSDTQVAAAFHSLSARWQAGLAKLESLQPPPQLSAATSRLKSQITKVKADLAAIAGAAKSHDAAAAKQATTQLVNDILGAKATAQTIEK